MCLHSLANSGLKPKLFDKYRTEIIQVKLTQNVLLSVKK